MTRRCRPVNSSGQRNKSVWIDELGHRPPSQTRRTHGSRQVTPKCGSLRIFIRVRLRSHPPDAAEILAQQGRPPRCQFAWTRRQRAVRPRDWQPYTARKAHANTKRHQRGGHATPDAAETTFVHQYYPGFLSEDSRSLLILLARLRRRGVVPGSGAIGRVPGGVFARCSRRTGRSRWPGARAARAGRGACFGYGHASQPDVLRGASPARPQACRCRASVRAGQWCRC
jgi:hypothetical protein